MLTAFPNTGVWLFFFFPTTNRVLDCKCWIERIKICHFSINHSGLTYTLPYSFIHSICPYDSLFSCKRKMSILINGIIYEATVLTFLNFIPINLINFHKFLHYEIDWVGISNLSLQNALLLQLYFCSFLIPFCDLFIKMQKLSIPTIITWSPHFKQLNSLKFYCRVIPGYQIDCATSNEHQNMALKTV